MYCSVTRLPTGPYPIFLINNLQTFNGVFITEDSSSGYMTIIKENDSPKKIMKSSILYIESSEKWQEIGTYDK